MSDARSVAIIGVGCRFPGGVTDVASFWQLLIDGIDAISEIPADRIDLAQFYDERPSTPGRMMTRRGGFVGPLEEFDAMFFGIAPRDAERLDPQQRLLLETAWEALEDAGVDALAIEGSDAAVFMGQWTSDFENRLFTDPGEVDFSMTLGSGRYGAAARLSYALGLRGPSLSIDAACSSGLACVHLAVQSLRQGECTLALAGAANLILQPHIHIAYSQSRMMAPDGHCKFGDASGDGYVRSEGVAVLVLKPLEAARRDGDRVHAVIRGSAVNNDGRSSGSMGRPSRVGQVELLRRAYADAGVPAAAVGYVEAHGTGTRAGDPVELSALADVLSEGRPSDARAWVGSVKTNIGHTEATAGLAGIIKAALVLRHDVVPPSLHHVQPNPNIAWSALPVAVANRQQPLPRPEGRRLAGVSAYGIGGTNAHVVLEAADAPASRGQVVASTLPAFLPVSARSAEALAALAGRLAEMIDSPQTPDVASVAAALARRRTALEYRAAFVGSDPRAVADALRAFARGEAPAHAAGQVAPGHRPMLAFVVPGQGAQWLGMARELLEHDAAFREALVACDTALRPWAEWSIVEQLTCAPGSAAYRLERIDVLQPVLVAMAIAYAAWLRSVGIEPDAVVGHSMGEVAAAHLAGALDLGQCMRIIARRSALMQSTSGRGAMALVDLSMDDALARIAGRDAQLSVAVSNSPRSSVISGDPRAVREVIDALETEGVFCRLVNVDVASHSPQMQPLAEALERDLADLVASAPRVPIVSTVTGERADGPVFDAAYWARNLRQPVRFAEAARTLLDMGATVFVELSPHALLSVALQQNGQAADREVSVVACGRRDEPDAAAATSALASLWVAGVAPDWPRLAPDRAWHVPLPLYPWQRERHWTDVAELRPAGQRTRPGGVVEKPDATMLSWLYRPVWRLLPAARKADASPARCAVLVGDPGRRIEALAAAAATAGWACHQSALTPLPGLLRRLATDVSGPIDVVAVAGDGPEAAYLPVALVQAIPELSVHTTLRLWWLTHGAQAPVAGARERVAPWQAALWGAARVVAEEHPAWWGGLVDADPNADDADNARAVIAHLGSASGEDQVALRGQERFALRLERHAPTGGPPAAAWRTDATCLITGGQGEIALHLARALVDQGVRRFVLLGRTPLPPREDWAALDPDGVIGKRVAAIRNIEAAGAAVHPVAVDVADEPAMRAFLEQYASQGWPAIRSVIHAAGVFDNQLASLMTRTQFEAAVRAKLTGAQVLDRLLPDLDHFVMFSSTGAFLAQPGQANYAAANAGLDALALDRLARGVSAQSIAWGVWRGAGLVRDDSGARNVAEMQRQGIGSFEPARGCAMFTWLCGRNDATPIVLPMDWARYREARAGRPMPMFAELLADAAPNSAGHDGDVPARLAAMAPIERRKYVESLVREVLGHVLKIAPARIDPRKNFGAMGLGSLLAIELRNRLEAALQRSLSATLAWNHPHLEALVAFLAADPSTEAIAVPQTAPGSAASAAVHTLATSVGATLDTLSGLSDDDAALTLLGRKGRTRR